MNGTRYNFLLILFLLIAVLWLAQLFSIQVMDVYKLKRLRLQRNSPVKEFINPVRGSIYDRNDELLVTTEKFFQVDIDLNAIEKYLARNGDKRTIAEVKDKIANLCTNITGANYQTIKDKLNSPSPILFYSLDEMTKDELISSFKRNKINGYITEFIGYKRKYTAEDIAPRLIGGLKENREKISGTRINKSKYSIEGITGIEASYNDDLSGEFGWKEVIKDANGNDIPALGLQNQIVVDGYNLQLTIDSELQHQVEKILRDKVDEYDAEVGMCTVMDPKTGEIIVMAGISKEDKSLQAALLRSYGNLPVSYKFEPGSTFKPFTMLGAMDNNAYNPLDKIDCRAYYPNYTGQKKNKERKITDDHPVDYPLTGEEIIAFSSNVGIAKVAEKLGEEKFYQLLRKMGFGQTVSTKFYGLTKGQLSPISQWTQFSLHSISFGQEIGVTQLQLANAYSAIANGGELLNPIIVKKVFDNNGNIVHTSQKEVLRRIAKKSAVEDIKKYLEKVFDYGTGKNFQNEIIGLAGKTGTAEVKSSKTRGTDKWEYTATFAGYLPKDDPQYVIVVTFDKPARKYRFAATSALPTFKEVYEKILYSEKSNLNFNYTVRNSDMIEMPALEGLTIADAEKKIKSLGVEYITNSEDPRAKVNQQYPAAGVIFKKDGNKVLFYSTLTHNNNEDVLPDFRKSPIRRAIDYCNKNNIKMSTKGQGLIYDQSIAPGTKLTENMELVIKCR